MNNLTSMSNEQQLMVKNNEEKGFDSMELLNQHKSKANKSEVLYYLEEMYGMDLLSDEEIIAYERYMWEGKMSKKHYNLIRNNMKKEFFNKF